MKYFRILIALLVCASILYACPFRKLTAEDYKRIEMEQAKEIERDGGRGGDSGGGCGCGS